MGFLMFFNGGFFKPWSPNFQPRRLRELYY